MKIFESFFQKKKKKKKKIQVKTGICHIICLLKTYERTDWFLYYQAWIYRSYQMLGVHIYLFSNFMAYAKKQPTLITICIFGLLQESFQINYLLI